MGCFLISYQWCVGLLIVNWFKFYSWSITCGVLCWIFCDFSHINSKKIWSNSRENEKCSIFLRNFDYQTADFVLCLGILIAWERLESPFWQLNYPKREFGPIRKSFALSILFVITSNSGKTIFHLAMELPLHLNYLAIQ